MDLTKDKTEENINKQNDEKIIEVENDEIFEQKQEDIPSFLKDEKGEKEKIIEEDEDKKEEEKKEERKEEEHEKKKEKEEKEKKEGDEDDEEKKRLEILKQEILEKDDKDLSEEEKKIKEAIKEEEENDVFNLEKLDDEENKSDNVIDYKELGKDFEIEFDENEEVNKDVFTQKIKEKIEDAKQKVELDLSKYDENTQNINKFVEDGGTPNMFIDKTKDVVNFLANTDQDKLRSLKIAELKQNGITDNEELIEQANDYVEQCIEDGTFDDKVKEAINLALNTNENIVNSIVNEFNSNNAKEKEKLEEKRKTENNQLINIVKESNDFLGKQIPEKTKEEIIKRIEDGHFHNELDNAQAQYNAWMFMKFGKKIINDLKDNIDKKSSESHREGVMKMLKELHNSKEIDSGGRGGHRSTQKPIIDKNGLPDLSGFAIDEDEDI